MATRPAEPKPVVKPDDDDWVVVAVNDYIGFPASQAHLILPHLVHFKYDWNKETEQMRFTRKPDVEIRMNLVKHDYLIASETADKLKS